MTSNFPTSADSIANNVVNSTPELDTHPNLHNQLADAVNAVETALLPGGSMNLAAHVAAADPHSVYLTQPEGDARYALIGGGGGGAPSGPAGGALSGTYPNPTLAADSVSSANIASKTITAADIADGVIVLNSTLIADGAINAAKIQDNTITSAKIADGTISTNDFANLAITSPAIANDAVITRTIQDGAVTSAKIADGTVAAVDMAGGAAATNVGTLGGSLAGTLPNPTLAANSVGASQITDGSVGNAELSIQIPRQNLLVNGGFEIWQRGVGPFAGNVYSADRWFTATPGTGSTYSSSVTRAAGGNQDVPSNFCWTCTYTHSPGNNSIVYQKVEDVLWSWRPLCFTLRVKCTVANGVRAWISGDGGTTKTYSSYHTGGGAYETLTCSFQNAITGLWVGWEFSATGTYYVDNAMLVIGQSPGGEWEALHPADEQMRCQRYYEIIGETATSFQINMYATAGGVIQSWLPYKTRKAVTPTLTKVGTWSVSNAAQPALAFPGFDGCDIQVTATALGMAAVANNTAGNTITIEANP